MSKPKVKPHPRLGSSAHANPKTKTSAAMKYASVGSAKTASLAGKKFHFIGAGGVGMSGLAQLLLKNRAIVTGSDQTASSITARLSQLGADIHVGHSPDNIALDTDVVVVSAAIRQDNPELRLARQRGCKIYKYAQMLGELMHRYQGIAVAGTHGKSTTTAWLSFLLRQAGIDVSFVVGAEVSQLGSSCGVGDSMYFVAEACEYDRSFLNLKPKIACILNIEQDHLDYYKDENEIVDAFGQFASGTRPGGVVIANGQDANVARMLARTNLQDGANNVRCETFGFDKGCDFHTRNVHLVDGVYTFDLFHNSDRLGVTRISLPGKHNVLNALAVVALGVNIGLPGEHILRLLPAFVGVDRRLMLKGRVRQVTILDDYAHHPTEIRATLQAIRQRYQPKRIWCVFQPHQYSRTRFLLDDFAESFKLADITIVPEIYFVRDSEASRKQVNSEILVQRIRANGTHAMFIDSFDSICSHLTRNVAADDLVVTMGAGDIWKVADEYIARLKAGS
jgi:UDP-N-acetylmuramate--alanine ligase